MFIGVVIIYVVVDILIKIIHTHAVLLSDFPVSTYDIARFLQRP